MIGQCVTREDGQTRDTVTESDSTFRIEQEWWLDRDSGEVIDQVTILLGKIHLFEMLDELGYRVTPKGAQE